MIGQTISHYKILEKLGEGGMGVVFKAHDTELDRDVALKFLPRDVAMSDEERSRFIHEAKAASALEHTNICAIHHVDRTPDGQMFIVMGYYEGRSVSKMVAKGPLDIGEAVSIAIQIAEGLQAAHEKGIVHRDIKSSNIIVSDKGQVKILDFGLAQKRGLSKLTRTGTTVGTAAYMSPEQARGEKLDQRTDLWSLGVVLYEMVAGKLPFRGEHEAAILYSVVNEAPAPVQTLVPAATPELIHIISRALEKDPAERYKTAEDMLIDLRRLKKDTSRSGFTPVSRQRRPNPNQFRNRILIAAGAIVVIALAYLYFMSREVEINPDMTFRPLKLPFTDIGYPGISGDGNWIAFGASDRGGRSGLYMMHSSGGDLRQIIATTGMPVGADVSPDGSLIAYNVFDNFTRINSMFIIHSIGGTPLSLGPGDVYEFRPDGRRMGYIRGNGHDRLPSDYVEFWSVAVDGSDSHLEFIDSLGTWDGNSGVSYSPDGRKVAWIRAFKEGYQEVIIHDLETGEERALTSDKAAINYVSWVREDQIAYTTRKSGLFNVWLTRLNGGPSIQITNETTAEPDVMRATTDGRKILCRNRNFVSDLFIVDIAENRSQQIAFGEDFQMQAAFSPDGRQIASSFSNDNIASFHIAVMDRDGRNRKQLTFGEERATAPIWSPDGKRLAYTSRRKSEPQDSARTYLLDLSNPGAPSYVARGNALYWFDSTRLEVGTREGVFITSIDRSSQTPLYDDSTWAYCTPGGKYIVYLDLRLGKDSLQWWIVDGRIPREAQRKSARKLFKSEWLTIQGNWCYWMTKVGEAWRMELPDGKPARIEADLLGVDASEFFRPSMDGKEIIIGKWRFNSSLVIIDNLFK